MNDLAVAVLVPAVLIGLNHLAQNTRAEGRGWRVSEKLTWFGVRVAVVGVLVIVARIYIGNVYRTWDDTLIAGLGLALYTAGVVTVFLSLLLRLWLRFGAYLRKVGPGNFARNLGHLGLALGKAGLKLGGMVLAANLAGQLLGVRNLLFLRWVRDEPLFGDSSEPTRKDGERTYSTPPPAWPPGA